jgi:hypothetical protein
MRLGHVAEFDSGALTRLFWFTPTPLYLAIISKHAGAACAFCAKPVQNLDGKELTIQNLDNKGLAAVFGRRRPGGVYRLSLGNDELILSGRQGQMSQGVCGI